MATIELKVPEIGESITEVQIGAWLRPEGSQVNKDEPLVEIESDKATVEFPAPSAGVIRKIIKNRGDQAAVGDVIALLEEGATSAASLPASPASPAPVKKEEKASGKSAAAAASPAPKAAPAPAAKASPMPTPVPAVKPAASATAPMAAAAAPTAAAHVSAGANEEAVPMSPIRKRIAQRLVEAQSNAALLTTFNEVDMTAVKGMREKYQPQFQEKYGIKLGFMSFFVKAVVEGLKMIPAVNAEVRGTNIIYKNHFDIGVAVGGGKGLVVPVIRNADRMSFAEIEKTIADFGRRAKENKIALDELEGGTFTISNGGIYGSLLSTPIVNPPQSGILGLHAIQERPMAVNGQVVIRPMMYVALTYDHRIVDGREAVTFLKHVKELMEDPARMLMEV